MYTMDVSKRSWVTINVKPDIIYSRQKKLAWIEGRSIIDNNTIRKVYLE